MEIGKGHLLATNMLEAHARRPLPKLPTHHTIHSPVCIHACVVLVVCVLGVCCGFICCMHLIASVAVVRHDHITRPPKIRSTHRHMFSALRPTSLSAGEPPIIIIIITIVFISFRQRSSITSIEFHTHNTPDERRACLIVAHAGQSLARTQNIIAVCPCTS